MPDDVTKREAMVARVAELLEEEFYETLQDAAGAGEAYDYEAFARRIVAALEAPDA